jgi:hypothetical protein
VIPPRWQGIYKENILKEITRRPLLWLRRKRAASRGCNMITIIDMVTGKIVHSGKSQAEPAEQIIQYDLPTTPALQEVALHTERRKPEIPADLVAVAVDEFLRNR